MNDIIEKFFERHGTVLVAGLILMWFVLFLGTLGYGLWQTVFGAPLCWSF